MRRIGVLTLILMMGLIFIYSCGEKAEEAKQTGVQIRFRDCLIFAVYLWIDDNYVGTFSSEEPFFLDMNPGNHTLRAKSNYVITGEEVDEYFCWDTTFTVYDGKTTFFVLECEGHTCADTSSTETE